MSSLQHTRTGNDCSDAVATLLYPKRNVDSRFGLGNFGKLDDLAYVCVCVFVFVHKHLLNNSQLNFGVGIHPKSRELVRKRFSAFWLIVLLLSTSETQNLLSAILEQTSSLWWLLI